MYCRFQLHARTLFLAVLLFAAAACVARPTEAKKTVKFQVPIEKAYEGIRVSSMVSVVLDDRDRRRWRSQRTPGLRITSRSG